MPGGGGLRLKYSNPIHVDDVAADFPDMKVSIAHPSWPWQDEALSVSVYRSVRLAAQVLPPAARAIRKFAAQTQDVVRLRLSFDRARSVDRGVSQGGFEPEVRDLILKDNAVAVLGL